MKLPLGGFAAGLALVALAACGGDASPPPACDPAAQTCGAGSRCDLICAGTTPALTCTPEASDGPAPGQSCSKASPCRKGAGCFAAPDSNGQRCFAFCDDAHPCTQGTCSRVAIALSCGSAAMPTMVGLCR